MFGYICPQITGTMGYKIERLRIIDELLSSGKPVSFQDCVDRMEPVFRRLDDKLYSSSMDSAYGDNFRQDIKTIREIIKTPANEIDPDMLITEGSKRYTKYRYKVPGFSVMPYLEYQYTQADYKKLEKALKILGNNLPTDVFERIEFALLSRIEYDYGRKEKSIDYGENYRLRGRDRLPFIYKCINKTVLTVTYKTYIDVSETYLLHPYLLKQYNNRWFLFGYRPDKEDKYWCVPLDRIEDIKAVDDLEIDSRPKDYNAYFDDIIGTTKGMLMEDGRIDRTAEKMPIKVKVTDLRTWKRIITKPIHKSQRIIDDFENGLGMFELTLIPNNEFYYRLISTGSGIKIVEPERVVRIMDLIIAKL